MTASAYTTPVRLKGERVTLERLTPEHHDELVDAVKDGELWKLWFTQVPTPEKMSEEIAHRLRRQDEGTMIPLVLRAAADGQVLGMTTYYDPDAENRNILIGYTWMRASVQGTGVNAEAKLLMLRHAFEVIGCERVELRAHHMNLPSRRAIERLGAHLDGILRRHTLMENGTWRDSCVYSILKFEWPAVEMGLQARLE
ncbi:GNAT family N-acetyltransferase [Corynebacterium suicordis]|uniref:GNAT family N-acetyltransferase n=1 Tax=Corynebacterium suicordis DSM 45110 TaxID=1121369 RepID=A0ABR9ZIF4_9CORY|nr:GNAT family protein [Corynebacterium suicordis]MBF4553144.1 GNAT family N-acetyltransferase [Corynebacterium suicordis DSM 45110]MDR6277893.1 RimJ/RimL family protein N-acetyltransferase [Corynebacterium suicordis]